MENRCEECGDWYYTAYPVDSPEPSLCKPCKESYLDYENAPEPDDRESAQSA